MATQMQQLGALSLSPPKEHRPIKVKDDRAAYMVGGKGFFNDRDMFLYPGQATYLDGEPNQDLIPLNKLAYDNMQTFLDKLDAFGEKRAKKEGRQYNPQPRQAWLDEGVVDDLPQPEFVMGSRKTGPDDTIR